MPRLARPRIHPSRQARSRDTAERIARALVGMLARRSLDEIAVPELCARARASPSSFYARFSDKRAVLDWVEETYFEASRREMAALLEPSRWEGAALAEVVRGLMRGYVRFLREHEPVLRTIVLANRARPASRLSVRSRAANLQSYERVAELLLSRRAEIRHPRPELAVRLGLAAAYALSHELVLFARSGLHPLELADAEVARALADTFLGVLERADAEARG